MKQLGLESIHASALHAFARKHIPDCTGALAQKAVADIHVQLVS